MQYSIVKQLPVSNMVQEVSTKFGIITLNSN
jgi:hypothetical protein